MNRIELRNLSTYFWSMPTEIINSIRRMAEEGKFNRNWRLDLKLLLLEEDAMIGKIETV